MTELKLSQQLVMTPQLQMAIRLLSLPLHELLEELPDLVQKNPPLETRPREGALDASFEVSVSSELVVSANDVYPTFVIYLTTIPLTFDAPADEDADDITPRGHTPEEIAFARNAMWLVRAIRQRARSYLKLARTIVSLVPPEALTDGSTELPKIKLRDLATTLGMHESTIVRMTGADQRMRAPRGDVPFLAFLKTR